MKMYYTRNTSTPGHYDTTTDEGQAIAHAERLLSVAQPGDTIEVRSKEVAPGAAHDPGGDVLWSKTVPGGEASAAPQRKAKRKS